MPAKVNINTAGEMGFCAGVTQAIEKAEKAAEKYGQVQMLGDIVHNEIVVEELTDKGVVVIDNLESADRNIPILFRAHGTPKELWQKAKEMGLQTIDATCPLVKEIHKYAKILENEDRSVFIIGDKGHDEVNGIASQVSKPIIISESEDIPKHNISKAGVVIQSTQNFDKVKILIVQLLERVKDLRIINTICAPTRNRQQEVKKLAKSNDLIIIVGSFTSANTKRLVKVAQKINPNTKQVESPDDLRKKWFDNVTNVGLSAGASTPNSIIEDVKRKITSF
ncbi:MAG: 4-hydroxy-3-methylbut-2-enyl diphosphate reductase [Candidatus Marinimicrobia bacterium]|nr:4-hydroxy-3-methylbut-2-enyl diphosphate reductase [Candidatus Neomarinimicrobiota bacterium]